MLGESQRNGEKAPVPLFMGNCNFNNLLVVEKSLMKNLDFKWQWKVLFPTVLQI